MPLEMLHREQVGTTHGVRVNWGSIFCGGIATLGFGALSVLFGNAIGLSPVNMLDPLAGGGLRAATFIYTLISMCVSFYIGGLLTARIGELVSVGAGLIYGLCTWALSGIFIVAFGIDQSQGVRAIVGGRGPNAANWLVLGITLFGAVFAAFGGQNGATRIFIGGAKPAEGGRPAVEPREAA